jgi:hypothetical protein
MKECDNSTRKIHISSNFILSISLLIMFDTFLLRPSLYCNTPLHFTTLHPTPLHNTHRRFTSSHLPFTTLSFSFTHLHFLSFYTSRHITSHQITSHHWTQYRSHPQNYFQKSKPLHCPKKCFSPFHFTSHLI